MNFLSDVWFDVAQRDFDENKPHIDRMLAHRQHHCLYVMFRAAFTRVINFRLPVPRENMNFVISCMLHRVIRIVDDGTRGGFKTE